MSEPIEVGDLVAVVRSCCDAFPCGHWVFVVDSFSGVLLRANSGYCKFCFANLPSELLAEKTTDSFVTRVPISWLKRIPPLSELEGEKRDEEITA